MNFKAFQVFETHRKFQITVSTQIERWDSIKTFYFLLGTLRQKIVKKLHNSWENFFRKTTKVHPKKSPGF